LLNYAVQVTIVKLSYIPSVLFCKAQYQCRCFDLEVAEACHMYGVKLIPYGVLAGGFLSGKYLNGARPEGARYVSRRCLRVGLKLANFIFDFVVYCRVWRLYCVMCA
jgi:hypothetical protein